MTDELIQQLDDKFTLGDISREWHDAVEQELNWADSADVVEVVRCKDCTHHTEPYCTRFITGMIPVSDNDFCSFGERKETE